MFNSFCLQSSWLTSINYLIATSLIALWTKLNSFSHVLASDLWVASNSVLTLSWRWVSADTMPCAVWAVGCRCCQAFTFCLAFSFDFNFLWPEAASVHWRGRVPSCWPLHRCTWWETASFPKCFLSEQRGRSRSREQPSKAKALRCSQSVFSRRDVSVGIFQVSLSET